MANANHSTYLYAKHLETCPAIQKPRNYQLITVKADVFILFQKTILGSPLFAFDLHSFRHYFYLVTIPYLSFPLLPCGISPDPWFSQTLTPTSFRDRAVKKQTKILALGS